MFDRDGRNCLVRLWPVTLLVVSGFVSTAGAGTSESALMKAARTQDTRAVRTLIAHKADVNAQSSDGSTALLWLAHWNDLATADLLLRAGADPNTANGFRMTPLSQACTNSSAEFVRLLLKAGANANAPIATGEITAPASPSAFAPFFPGNGKSNAGLLLYSLNTSGRKPPWKTPRYAAPQTRATPQTTESQSGTGVTFARGSWCSRWMAAWTSVKSGVSW